MKIKREIIISFLKTHINQLILATYLSIIWVAYVFQFISPHFKDGLYFKILFLLVSATIFILSYYISTYLLRITQKFKLPKINSNPKKNTLVFITALLASLLITCIWFIAYQPGGFSGDSISQYGQALSGNYNDWHPVLHTLLFFTIPLNIFQNISAIVICQIILFSIIFAYSIMTIYEIAGKKWCVFAAIIVLLNPYMLNELMYPWKDVAFAIFALFIITATLKIYYTQGAWGNKISHIIILAVVLCFATIFRHNAILFTLPSLLFFFFFLKRKQWLKLCLIFLTLIFIVKIPLYSLLHVTYPDRRTEETMGLSLTILGNIAKEDPQALDAESSSFIYSIAPLNKWQSDYTTGSYNSIKWNQINSSIINETSPIQILKMTANSFLNSPTAGLTALLQATQPVYGIEGDIGENIIPYISPDNQYNIHYTGNNTLRTTTELYTNFFDTTIFKYIKYVGITIILIFIFVLGKNPWSKNGWKKILLCTPILFYDFGTMLLLSGPEIRFFFVNYLVFPTIIILAICIAPRPKPKKQKSN